MASTDQSRQPVPFRRAARLLPRPQARAQAAAWTPPAPRCLNFNLLERLTTQLANHNPASIQLDTNQFTPALFEFASVEQQLKDQTITGPPWARCHNPPSDARRWVFGCRPAVVSGNTAVLQLVVTCSSTFPRLDGEHLVATARAKPRFHGHYPSNASTPALPWNGQGKFDGTQWPMCSIHMTATARTFGQSRRLARGRRHGLLRPISTQTPPLLSINGQSYNRQPIKSSAPALIPT